MDGSWAARLWLAPSGSRRGLVVQFLSSVHPSQRQSFVFICEVLLLCCILTQPIHGFETATLISRDEWRLCNATVRNAERQFLLLSLSVLLCFEYVQWYAHPSCGCWKANDLLLQNSI